VTAYDDDGTLQVRSHRSDDGTYNGHPTIVSLRLRRAREHYKQFRSRLHQQHVHNSLDKLRTLNIIQKRELSGDFYTIM